MRATLILHATMLSRVGYGTVDKTARAGAGGGEASGHPSECRTFLQETFVPCSQRGAWSSRPGTRSSPRSRESSYKPMSPRARSTRLSVPSSSAQGLPQEASTWQELLGLRGTTPWSCRSPSALFLGGTASNF